MTAVIAASPFVQVVSAPEAEVVAAAGRLRAQLAAEERLRLGAEVLVVDNGAYPTTAEAETAEVTKAIDAAYDAYVALDPPSALAKIAEVRAKLGLRLDDPAARALLARGMRIKGLVHLFGEKTDLASTAFYSASLLAPDFIPDSQQWPPEARLAYADAIAAARRASGGILSVDVAPPAATLWLNGRKAGIGPTTLSELPPGEHFVLATCPGFNRVTAVVTVEGGGKLNQAALYLEQMPEEKAQRAQVAAFHAAFGRDGEAAAGELLAQALGAQHLIYVVNHGGARAAWILDAAGARQRDPVVVVSGNDAAKEIRIAILGEDPKPIIEPPPELPPPPPEWYERWEVWLVIGAAAAVAGGTAIYIGASQGQNESLFFYIGDK